MKKVMNFLLWICGFAPVFSQTPSFVTDSLDNYIRQGMNDWQVPGLSIVIVKDGKIAFMKGYGVRSVESKEPVTENTLFMIASNSKLFTSVALAQLEKNKLISLDEQYKKYFPDFRLYQTNSSDMVTIRDLLSHRIGTKTFQGDFTFWNSKLTSRDILKRMRLLKPSSLFRQDYGYCNSCYLAAAQAIPKFTGKSWKDYVKDSILIPLAMNDTYTSIKDVPDRAMMAKPYTTSFTGNLNEVPYDEWDNLGPAAALISNVSDLAKWLFFQLDSGRVNGKEIMSFGILQKTRDINTIVNSRKNLVVPTHIVGYGLGLLVADYNGRQVYWHTGGAAGMLSNVCFVPEERLGIAVLTNNDNQNLYGALRAQILDAYLNVNYKNRSKLYYEDFQQTMKDTLKTINGWKARVKGNMPPLSLNSYAGRYLNPLYGSIDISVKGKQLHVKFNSHENLSAMVDYMDSEEWLLQYNNILYGIYSIKFKMDNKKVMSVDIRMSDFVEEDPYTFTKQVAGK